MSGCSAVSRVRRSASDARAALETLLERGRGFRRGSGAHDGGRCGRQFAKVEDAALEHEAPVAVALDVVGEALRLQVDAVEDLQVRVELRRQLARVAAAVFGQLLLVILQPAARFDQLGFEERVGAFGQHFALAYVLLDELRRQPLGDEHRRSRLGGHVADAEGVTAHEVDVDRVAHPPDERLHRHCRALLRIQIEVDDRPFEPIAAEDLLPERGQPILDTARHGCAHVALRHPLRNDQDRRFRAVLIGERACVHRGRRGDDHRRQRDQPLAVPRDAQDVFDAVRLSR